MSASKNDEKPPRVSRGLYLRYLIAAVLIVICTASTVASAGLIEVNTLVAIVKNEGHVIPNIKGALEPIKGALTSLVEAREGGLGGAEILAEEGDSLGRCKRIVEKQFAPGHFDASFSSQTFGDHFFHSPERRRQHAGRRRSVPRRDLEHLANEAFWGPVSHGDQAAGAADAE
jgi:hypothetical protein